MKDEINAMCDSWIRISADVLENHYNGRWTPQYDSVLRETIRKLIYSLDFAYRHDPDFRINEDLSNVMEDDLRPNTEQIGREIREIVISRFSAFSKEKKK